ncbi:cyclin-like protein [Polychytrium aggregatum]|uniref:cyclin-like protein n=1 Tax=Polychytrium aggregatum TaxID=110093 RepID=UPI0022FEF800|nr:cyclin-like protein [Polychytrium aggregatum]KAI9205915.1 cyclin-like protein [Polychytrium aggregatum]
MQVDKEPIRPQKKPTSSSESRLNNLFILHDRDPVILLEYEKEIIDHLRLIEQQTMPSGDYLTRQPQITALMRSQLVEWIVDVHTYLRLLPETLFLTINIMDRYLSSNSVHLHKFQLVAVVSLLIASKVEEIRVPKIQELVFLTDNTYGREEIIKAERYILSRLGYDVGHPGPFTFLRRISVADGLDTKIRTVAKYLMECSLTNEKFLECPASLLAASAMYVAMKVLKNGEWSDAHIHYSGYQESEVVYGGRLLLDTAYNLSTSSPIYRKWADDSLMCASTFLTAYFKHIQFTPFSSA